MERFRKAPRWFFAVLGAGSCWWLAFDVYQNAHLPPGTTRSLPKADILFVLEFLLIHSGVMLSGILSSPNMKGRTLKPVLFVSFIYAVFGVAIALASQSLQLFLTFSGIMISRWMGLVSESGSVRLQQFKRSMAGFLLLFGTLLVTLVLESSWDMMLVVYFCLAGLAEVIEPFQQSPKLLLFRTVSVAVVAGGMFSTFPAARDLSRGYASQHWPQTDGVLKGSWMRQTYSDGTLFTPQHLQYEAKVNYSYSVAGQSYSGTHVSWNDHPLADTNLTQAILDKYSTHYVKRRKTIYFNPKVAVYYDPGDPALAVLEPGPGGLSWKFPVIGLMISFVGVVLLTKAIRMPDTAGNWQWGGSPLSDMKTNFDV